MMTKEEPSIQLNKDVSLTVLSLSIYLFTTKLEGGGFASIYLIVISFIYIIIMFLILYHFQSIYIICRRFKAISSFRSSTGLVEGLLSLQG